MKAAISNILKEARRLKPGFGIISDIYEFAPTKEERRLLMQSTMKTLKQDIGMGHAVRIA